MPKQSKPKILELRFPSAGLVRRHGYQQSSPYSTPDCQNVRPFDALEGRERGGSRPGIVKALDDVLGSGSPVQCLAPVDVIASDQTVSNVLVAICNGATYYSAAGSAWAPVVTGSELVLNPGFETHTGTEDDDTSDTWTSWTDSVSDGKLLAMSDSVHGGSRAIKMIAGASFNTFVRTGHRTVVAGRSMRLSFWTRGDATYEGRYSVRDVTHSTWIISNTPTGVTSATYAQVIADFQIPTGCTTIYIVLYCPGTNTGFAYFDDVSCKELSTLNSSAPALRATSHHQELYIADYRPTKISGADGVIASTNRLSAASISDWTTQSIDITRDVVLMTGTPGGTSEDDVYAITAVASGYITVDGTLTNGPAYSTGTIAIDDGIVTGSGTDFPTYAAEGKLTVGGVTYTVDSRGSGTALTLDNLLVDVTAGTSYSLDFPVVWEIGRKIKVFDPSDNTVASITATYGIPPINCPLACTYRDRVVMVGGNTWYMSRQGDATDWDYGYDPSDVQRPMAGSVSDAGYVGEPILAVIPHSDDYLIFGCENSLWVMRGDPAGGGQINSLSDRVGIVSVAAWCKLPDGGLVFLSRNGLYMLSPGADSYPQALSQELLPSDLLDVDVSGNVVSMQYDARGRGIHLCITPTGGTTGEHWWLDWSTLSFYPVVLPNAQQPCAMVAYASDQAEQRHVLLGGYDGYVRRYDPAASDDDDTTLTSYVKLGPVRMGSPGMDGMLAELGSVLDEGSDDVTWGLHIGDTAEAAAANATARISGTWVAGRNRPTFPRIASAAGVLKLTSTGIWAMEAAYAVVAPGGRTR